MRRISYALIALAVIGCTSKAGEVTIYPLFCSSSLKNGDCHGEWLVLKRIVFRVSATKQSVSYSTPGKADSTKHLTKCVVRDTKDWQCSDPDGSTEMRMASGEFSSHIVSNTGSDVDKKYERRKRYVSAVRYWATWFSTWLKPPLEPDVGLGPH